VESRVGVGARKVVVPPFLVSVSFDQKFWNSREEASNPGYHFKRVDPWAGIEETKGQD